MSDAETPTEPDDFVFGDEPDEANEPDEGNDETEADDAADESR